MLGSSHLGPSSSIETTSVSLDWRSRNPGIWSHHDDERGAFYLPYNLLLLAVEHHDEDQADHVLVGQALLPPEDGVEQVLLEDLL